MPDAGDVPAGWEEVVEGSPHGLRKDLGFRIWGLGV